MAIPAAMIHSGFISSLAAAAVSGIADARAAACTGAAFAGVMAPTVDRELIMAFSPLHVGRPVWRRLQSQLGENRMRDDFAALGACFSRNPSGDAADCSIHDFDGRTEDVADTAFRDDELWLRGILFNFSAQPQYLNVDRPIIDLVVVHAARLQQLIPCKNSLGSGKQGREQVELPVGQCNVSAVPRFEAPRAQVEFELTEPVCANLLPRQAGSGALGAPQHGSYTRQQLARTKWFGQIVVGAELQPHDPIRFFAHACEHDDRYRRLLAQRPRDRHSIL